MDADPRCPRRGIRLSANFDLRSTPIDDGVTLIEASAGTGKTYCITGLVLRLLLERRVASISEVLVVTFTNAATSELIDRIRTALRDALWMFDEGDPTERDQDLLLLHLLETHGGDDARRGEAAELLRNALLEFDEIGVSTIHGFCSRVLEASAFESGVPYDLELCEDSMPTLKLAAEDFWRAHLYDVDEAVAATVVSRGWTPDTFVDDYRRASRFLDVNVMPPPPDLGDARDALKRDCERLVAAWDRGAMETFLASFAFNKPSKLYGDKLGRALDAMDSFCQARNPDGLTAARALTTAAIAKHAAKKKSPPAPYDCAIVDACDRLAETEHRFEHALRWAFVDEVGARFHELKRRSATFSYDDLLHHLHTALAAGDVGERLAATIRKRFKVALIDEFQDTDLLQYRIFDRIFHTGPLMLIGDPKQAIYAFRGADVFAYIAAKSDAARAYTLDRNWRSTEQLVNAVNAIFEKARRPFVFDAIPFERVDSGAKITSDAFQDDSTTAALQWQWLGEIGNKEAAVERAAEVVAAETVRLLSGGVHLHGQPLEPGNIAVLVRKHSQARAIQEALHAAGVPGVVSRSGDIFQCEEMRDLHAVLAAIADPGAQSRVRAAMATRLWGAGAADIHAMADDDVAWQTLIDDLEGYREQWTGRRTSGFMPMIQRLIADRRMRARLREYEDGDRRLTNLRHATEILHQATVERHLSPEALLGWLAFERGRDRHDADSAALRIERDARAVQIVTVHGAKGLEYDIAFCPFLWDTMRASERAPVVAHGDSGEIVFDCSEDRSSTYVRAESERLGEDLRLAYVALTRARHRCYVAWGHLGKDKGAASALAYLLHQHDDPAADENEAAWALRAIAGAGKESDGWLDDLREVVAAHADTMMLDVVDDTRGPARWEPPERAPRALAARVFPDTDRPRLRPWQMVSFSSLLSGVAREAPDHGDPAHGTRGAAETAAPRDIFAFARGARAGTCLHEILEHCDLAADDHSTTSLIEDTLTRHGLGTSRDHDGDIDPVATVASMIGRVGRCPLPGQPFSFADVHGASRLNEWQFYAALGDVTPAGLADVFGRHADGRVAEHYAPLLSAMARHTMRGYLTGFVDLVFEHDGRWFIVDWKSNHLGNTTGAYDDAGMWEAMCDHHYVLQYHIYALALHRYLATRLADYDYERDFGGAYYVFLRGLDENAETGWYRDRPPLALIEALDGFARGEAPA